MVESFSTISSQIPCLIRVIGLVLFKLPFAYKKRNFKRRHDTCKTEICYLDGETFIQRFLQHELPSGFMRIRHFGFLGNNCKKNTLRQIRLAVG